MSGRRDLVSTSIVPRIKAVLTAAEQTAAIVAEEAETEAGRRTAEILAAAEVDANRIRQEATRRVEDYLAATRRRIDAFAAARIERITEVTESLLEAAESIQERLEQATHVQQQVHAMIEGLGNVAEAVAQEAGQPSPTLPQPPSAPVRPAASRAPSNGRIEGEKIVGEGEAEEEDGAQGEAEPDEDHLNGVHSEKGNPNGVHSEKGNPNEIHSQKVHPKEDHPSKVQPDGVHPQKVEPDEAVA